jgi:hypothetical protein
MRQINSTANSFDAWNGADADPQTSLTTDEEHEDLATQDYEDYLHEATEGKKDQSLKSIVLEDKNRNLTDLIRESGTGVDALNQHTLEAAYASEEREDTGLLD